MPLKLAEVDPALLSHHIKESILVHESDANRIHRAVVRRDVLPPQSLPAPATNVGDGSIDSPLRGFRCGKRGALAAVDAAASGGGASLHEASSASQLSNESSLITNHNGSIETPFKEFGRGAVAVGAPLHEASSLSQSSDTMTVVIKTLSDLSSYEELSCLNNEYNVLTRQLSRCFGARKAIAKTSAAPGASPALYLEWVDGLTLQEWMVQNDDPIDSPHGQRLGEYEYRQGHGPSKNDLILRLRIAQGLAGALANVHDAGVIHNDVFTDNIMVDILVGGVSDGAKERVSVKIIDFGFATLLTETDLSDYDVGVGLGEDEGRTANDDIYALGTVLNELFLGKYGKIEMQTSSPQLSSAYREDKEEGGSDTASAKTEATTPSLKLQADWTKNPIGENLRSSINHVKNMDTPIFERIKRKSMPTIEPNMLIFSSRRRVSCPDIPPRDQSIVVADKLGVPTRQDRKQFSHEDYDLGSASEAGFGSIHGAGNAHFLQPQSQQLRNSGRRAVPQSVVALLSNLTVTFGGTLGDMEDTAMDPYRTARELEEDLKQMINDPNTFLYDCKNYKDLNSDVDGSTGADSSKVGKSGAGEGEGQIRRHKGPPLAIKEGKLYGKEANVQLLMDAYGRTIEGKGQSECVLIFGNSGTGKTTLFSILRDPVLQRKGYFIQGKFDSLHRGEPYSAIMDALSGFCDDILAKGGEALVEIRRIVRDAMGDQWDALTDIVPKLRGIIGTGDLTSSSKDDNGPKKAYIRDNSFTQNRLQHVFCRFIQAISTHSHPIVLCLDDLQWADKASLDLLLALVTDRSITSLLLVGCYRDKDIGSKQSLLSFLKFLKDLEMIEKGSNVNGCNGADPDSISDGVPLTRIHVTDINVEATNAFVSDTLRLTRRITRLLSETLHRKTNGNFFFIIQLLRSFRDEGLLRYSDKRRRWKWDAERVDATDLSDNVADLLAGRIRDFCEGAMKLIKVAARLGSVFDENILACLLDPNKKEVLECCGILTGGSMHDLAGLSEGESVSDILKDLIAKGVIVRVVKHGGDGNGVGGGVGPPLVYKFSHDRIRDAAYSLVLDSEKGRLHFNIGRLMLKRACPYCSSGLLDGPKIIREIFTIVDQFNCSVEFINSEKDRTVMADLNLLAGKKAMSFSAFEQAAAYLRQGIEFLGFDPAVYWRRDDKLALDLLKSLIEAEFCNCRYDTVKNIAKVVLEHGQSLKDKMPVYLALMKSHGALGMMIEACQVGFDVLRQLGEPFPPRPKKLHVLASMVKTKARLQRRTYKKLFNLPTMKTWTKIAAMKVLSSMFAYAHYVDNLYSPLISNCMVRLTLRHGTCNESAFGFATYGCILSGFYNQYKAGFRYGKVAISIAESLDSKEWVAHVQRLVISTISHWEQNLRWTLKPLLLACQIGLENGDNEYAMYSIMDYCSHSFWCGRPLVPLKDEIMAYCCLMKKHNQEVIYSLTVPYWQMILNLIGKSDNPLQLVGDAMNQDHIIEESQEKGFSLAVAVVNVIRLFLAYTFGNYALAEEMAKKTEGIQQYAMGMFLTNVHVYYSGLVCFALARETKNKKWVQKAKKAMIKMQEWAKLSAEGNCLHKALLMEAEFHSLKGKTDVAAMAYDNAIAAANKSGFVQDEALAYELGGIFYKDVGDEVSSSRFFARAQRLYQIWGAEAKAELLKTQYASFVNPGRRRRSFQSFNRRRGSKNTTVHVNPDTGSL